MSGSSDKKAHEETEGESASGKARSFALPSGWGQDSSYAIEPPKTVKKKLLQYDDSGRLVERWVDVVVQAEKPKPKMKDYDEFKWDTDITIGDVFKSLKDTRFDAVTLRNTLLVFLGKDINEFKKAGVWFETDVEFRGILQPISDALKTIFGQERPGIHLSAHLGLKFDPDNSLVADGFTFRGSIEGIMAKFGPLVQFRNVGIEISVKNSDINWGFVGSMDLKVPNSVVPLVLDYQLFPDTETCRMAMALRKNEKWHDVFGSGINISYVAFETTFSKKALSKPELTFSIAAAWSFKGVEIKLDGKLGGGDSYLRGTVENFTLEHLRMIFSSMTGQELEPVDSDIRIDKATITIAKGSLSFHGEVSVDGHKAAAATVIITPAGVTIEGAIGDVHLEHDIYIQQASISFVAGTFTSTKDPATKDPLSNPDKGKKPKDDIQILPSPSKDQTAPQTTQRVVGARISGTVIFQDIKFQVSLAVLKLSGGHVEWVVCGRMESDSLRIGQLVDEVDGTAVDAVMLKGVTLIASSKDGLMVPDLNIYGYPIKKGIQICAQLDSVPIAEGITNCKDPKGSYTLMASYSPDEGLGVKIRLPEDMRIQLSPNVVSGPLILEIVTRPEPKIKFAAVLWAKVDDNPEPLEFTLMLEADAIAAEGSATMRGWWPNPLGISPRLELGDVLALEVGINYATPTVPTKFGFVAGMRIDKTKTYKAALYASQNPKETLVMFYADELDVADIVQLIDSLMEDHHVPAPKQDLLRFEKINIYACAYEVMIGTERYTQGFSFQGAMYLCGKRAAYADCRIGKNGLKLYGEIAGFQLGPLTLKGATGDNAILDFEITKERQHFSLDGMIALWGLSVKINVVAELQPHPEFSFDFELEWSKMLKFKVEGKMLGGNAENEKAGTDLTKLEHTDFFLKATMHSEILTCVANQMQRYFDECHHSSKENIAKARQAVIDAKKEFDAMIERAKASVEAKHAQFKQTMAQAEADFEEKKKQKEQERLALEQEVKTAEVKAANDVAKEKQNVEQKKVEMEQKAQRKKTKLANTQKEGDEKIGTEIRNLQSKRVQLQNDFGNAVDAIHRAKQTVHHEQSRVWDVENRLAERRQAYDHASWFQRPGIIFSIGVLEAERAFVICELAAANFILNAAEAIVIGVAYKAALSAVDFASALLEKARVLWAGCIMAAQAALAEVYVVYNALIEGAFRLYQLAQEAGVARIKVKNKILSGFIEAEQIFLEQARKIVLAVAEGAEWLAYRGALAILDKAQKDTTLVDLAQAALDGVEAVEELVFAAAKWLTERIAKTLNIEHIELSGTLRSIVGDGPGFTIIVQGWIAGIRIDFQGTWSPGDKIGYLIKMCKELWEKLKTNMVQLFTEADKALEGGKRIQLIE